MNNREKVARLSSQLESLWSNLDALFGDLDQTDWQHEHGPDWVFADLPYHLAYFDRFMARYLTAGKDLPPDEQLLLDSLGAMSRWNEEQFALRPADHTPEQSLAEMQVAREQIRDVLRGLSDEDLLKPAWMSLTFLRGWRTVEIVILTVIMHTWNEFIQLRIHMGRTTPIPDPAVTHMALAGFLAGNHAFLDKEAAAKEPMIVQFEMTGPGGGWWTVHLIGNGAVVTEGQTAGPDLIFSQNVDTFMKTFNGMHDPAEAMQRGEIQVRGMENLSAYRALLPAPDLNTLFAAFPSR